MKKNKKFLCLGLVIVLLGIWLTIPSLNSSANIASVLGIFAFYGTPVGFILMLIGIFMKEK